MTTFAEKYANAPALREITADEVKCGQVIRAVWVYSNDSVRTRTSRVESVEVAASGLPTRIELIEDVPDPREELAKRLYETGETFRGNRRGSGWADVTFARGMYLAIADEAIRWADERAKS